MDIIAAHQLGLIEQLQEEVAALAGRPRDHVQRAMVLHHLYDHSCGAHRWALLEARRELYLAHALSRLAKRIDRWGWLASGRDRARTALAEFADAIGKASQARCAAAYLAYRLSAVPALRAEAELRVPEALLDQLIRSHLARRTGQVEVDLDELADNSERHSIAAVDGQALESAWAEIKTMWLGRSAIKWLGDRTLARSAERDAKRGWDRVERDLRGDTSLPAAFVANPAQHFYALHRDLAEKRRQQWREACDREPDAFELAA
jgi:hypothetical protein